MAAKMKNGCAGGYIISSHPSGMIMCTTNVQNEQGIEEEISYLGTTLFGQKKQKLAKSGTSYSSIYGASINDVTHLGRRGSAKRWRYSICKMGDKGEGRAKNLKKWVTSFIDYYKYLI